MKKLFLTLAIGLSVLLSYAQSEFAKATVVTLATKNETTGKFDWGQPQYVDEVLVKIDKVAVTIYSKITQQYFIYTNGEEITNGMFWYAYDKDGQRCRVYLMTNDVGDPFILIEYASVAWMYNLIDVE
jgi:hypothetical protein